jgi:ubiquinone/menaquinone biosynthesis C-methylase UbiE
MFAFIYSTAIDPLLRDIRIYTPEFSGMKAGDRMLDVCCGTGDQVIHCAKRGVIAAGIDRNPEMIDLAEGHKRKLGLNNASFKVADAQNLPFEDNFFDYASISLALHEIQGAATDKVVSEMRRVVEREGALIFIDFQVPLPKSIYTYLTKALEFIAGRDHHRNLKDYIGRGGLDGTLKKNNLPEVKRDYLKNGLMLIIEARNV